MPDKYDSLRTRMLYSRATVDEEVGSSSEGIGWAGLYLRWEGVGGYVIYENTDGLVTGMAYDTDEDLEKYWTELCEVLEVSGDPDHHDLVIQQNARTGEYFSLHTGEDCMFDTINELLADLPAAMEDWKELLGRNVWFLNERGNFIPLAVADYLSE